jgi:hypothetical protein
MIPSQSKERHAARLPWGKQKWMGPRNLRPLGYEPNGLTHGWSKAGGQFKVQAPVVPPAATAATAAAPPQKVPPPSTAKRLTAHVKRLSVYQYWIYRTEGLLSRDVCECIEKHLAVCAQCQRELSTWVFFCEEDLPSAPAKRTDRLMPHNRA